MKKSNLLILAAGLGVFVTSAVLLTRTGHHYNGRSLTRVWTYNWLGLILIAEFITRQLGSQSLSKWLFRRPQNLLLFIIACLIGGAAIEGLGQWVGKLWYYPFFSPGQYHHVFLLGFVLYMTTITEVYLAAKSLADRLVRQLKKPRTRVNKPFFRHLGWLGALMIIAAFVFSFRLYANHGGYFFNTVQAVNFHVSFWLLVLAPAGVWFVCEYIQHQRKQLSFLSSLAQGYASPLLAIALATIVVGVSMELINSRYGYWVYVNWPGQDDKLLNLPLVMILVAWPIQWVMWLSIYRVVAGKKSIDVWSP